ncbi:hypothetical protein CKN73_07750 [Carnobacterium divergens]|uniref:hypothetical protein n=1 Tax=Carnobacterium divergens TaxID=2748 RepID=UPI001072D25E|nr:hypothetical protein CKN77_07850 [Carnobacterium divergens]TFJ48829.1 hypothetical protein CKN73_07750 [Carnobacterium divergens]TFJ54093.1 hypothetical protein CKN83_07655 [Carnobacterium divergens]TFJ59619.1 hypothetical protein CKN89_08095 [Carnobacterium divergens]TFJ70263.1 hypothetical protein CKN91_07710 [Carnobacterium divergens]
MEIKLNVAITKNATTIQFSNNQSVIEIQDVKEKEVTVAQPVIYFLLKDRTVLSIGKAEQVITIENSTINKLILLTPPWEIELAYLEKNLITEAIKNGLKLENTETEQLTIPTSHKKNTTNYKDELLIVLERFGYNLQPSADSEKPAKTKSAKTRHKWTKEISQIEFFVDTRESKATVLWQKRNEMLLKAGAKLMPIAPLNKDGSVGFSAKMGEKLRLDYQDKIKDFVTTEDIVLKSVNEVGLLLYFAGTNSWLELLDSDGKSIDEWTKIEA